jgi:hypothetical protein
MDNEKLQAWLLKAWNVKERIVFGLVVCVLAFRAYQLMPHKVNLLTREIPLATPGAIPFTELPQVNQPMQAPPRDSWNELYKRGSKRTNMFMEGRGGSGGGGGEEGAETSLILHTMQSSPRGPMAQLSVEGGQKQYVREGDVFQSDYTVVKIDLKNGIVEVLDSATKKTIKLKLADPKKKTE